MDHPDPDLETIRNRVAAVVSLVLGDIQLISTSSAPEQTYSHHLLLRYLVNHGTTEERNAYLSAQDSWLADDGHPWPLIEAYRGVLLHPTAPEAAISHMENGHDFAENHGPTVRLIGLTLGIIAMGWGSEDLVNEQDLTDITLQLPAAADATATLQRALNAPLDPPELLLAEVLPFNFR